MKEKLMWRRAKAGHNFGKDTVVIPDGDPDARLVRCAVHDCIYISIEDLKKLPIESKTNICPTNGFLSRIRYVVRKRKKNRSGAK